MDKTFFGNQPLMQSELELAIQKAIAKPLSSNPTDYLDTSELHSLKLMAAMVDGMLEADSVNWSAFLHQKRINDVRQACE